MFQRLAKAGLSLALSKCLFGQDSLEYLGYRINSSGLVPLPKKVEALQKFPQPTKQKELLAYLGALDYYRSSLPRLAPEDAVDSSASTSRSPAAVLDPLYKLATCKIKKGDFTKIWDSSKIVQDSFSDSKTLLSKAVLLNYPILSAPLALSTDASQVCLGASLDQFVDGSWRPLGFWSKSLSPSQQKYSTYKRELLAIKLGIRHFIEEINGRNLICYTDHLPIIGSWKNPNLQQHDAVALNAINEIAQWTSDIRHKPGKELVVPDLLSHPFGSAHLVQRFDEDDPPYIPPESTLAAIQEVCLNVVSPSNLAKEQLNCEEVKNHRDGNCPKNVKMGDIEISGNAIFCEISEPANPRPLVPKQLRSLIVNLNHHQDHPSARETLRRIASDYYWPG